MENQLFATNKISVFFLFNQREKSLTQILWKNYADQRESSTDNGPRFTADLLEPQPLFPLIIGEKTAIRYELNQRIFLIQSA